MTVPAGKVSESFLDALIDAGPPLAVDPDSPLPLIEPGIAWYVQQGHADVVAMSITRERGANEFVRAHIARVGQGQVIFGFDAPRAGVNILLLGFGSRDLLVRRLSIDVFRSLAIRYPECAANTVDAWINSLCDGVGTSLAPAGSRVIRPGTSCSLDTGNALQPNAGVLWLEHLWGSSHLLGQDLASTLKTDAFPIARSAWLVALEPSGLKASVGSDLISSDSYWSGLSSFHAAIQAVIDSQARREREASRERLRAKSKTGKSLTESAFLDLRSAVGQVRSSRASSGDAGLLAVCRAIGEPQGVIIRDPQVQLPADAASALSLIARNSNARLRRIRLRGRWWTQHASPFVGFDQDSGDPVAIVPVRGSMHRVDSATRVSLPFNASNAPSIAPAAFELWPTLPKREASLRETLALATLGSTSDLAIVTAVSVLLSLLSVVPAITLGVVYRWAPDGQASDLWRFTAGALLAASIATVLLVMPRTLSASRLVSRASSRLAAILWDRILTLSNDAVSTTLDISILTSARHELEAAINHAASLIMHATAAACAAVILWLAIPTAVVPSAIAIALIATCLIALSLAANRCDSRAKASLDAADDAATQASIGIASIRVTAAEDRAFSRWASAYARWAKDARCSAALRHWAGLVATTAPLAAIAAVIAGHHNTVSIPALAVAVPAAAAMVAAGCAAASEILDLSRARSALQRLRALVATPPESDSTRIDPGPLRGKIELANVTFRYIADDAPVLDSLNLTIEPGEFIAVVGLSGCGKTTLARIILGLERPEAGAVFIDGHDAEGLDLAACRRQFGVVLQDAGLEPGDIFSNIVGSDPDLTHDDALEAARLAGLDRDLEAMPMGLHTVVAEGLPTLSGGQRQRILIARALARRPRVIIFDEATSSLDNPTQSHVMNSLERLNATRIVIAHRLSTIRNADRIIVLDQGRIVQAGTYDELHRSDGPFRNLIPRSG
jgi:ABC-type bacteriocin/lantibiotic exporter with double-glycine peptidase domain